MHQTPEITLTPSPLIEPVSAAPQINVAELQKQLILLQNQVSVLQASQKSNSVPTPIQVSAPASTKANLPIPPIRVNVLQPSPAPIGGLQLPQNEVVLLSMNRSPCVSPRASSGNH
jgi:hypothetical protein